MDTRRARSLWVEWRETIRKYVPGRSIWAPRMGRLMAANAASPELAGALPEEATKRLADGVHTLVGK